MFQENLNQGADASTHQPASLPNYDYEHGRHMLFGTLSFVRLTIQLLHTPNPTIGAVRYPPGNRMKSW